MYAVAWYVGACSRNTRSFAITMLSGGFERITQAKRVGAEVRMPVSRS